MKTLTLSIKDGTWYVTDEDPETLRLFGTNTLPTPYDGLTSPDKVVERLQTLNPDSIIKVKE